MMSGRVWQQVDLLLLGRLLVAFALVQNLFWLADDLQHARETESESPPRPPPGASSSASEPRAAAWRRGRRRRYNMAKLVIVS